LENGAHLFFFLRAGHVPFQQGCRGAISGDDSGKAAVLRSGIMWVSAGRGRL
jgi:hypothetical protein